MAAAPPDFDALRFSGSCPLRASAGRKITSRCTAKFTRKRKLSISSFPDMGLAPPR